MLPIAMRVEPWRLALPFALSLAALIALLVGMQWLAATPALAAFAGTVEPNPFRWPA